MTTFLLGLATGLALGIGFILFCMWHNSRWPMMPVAPMFEEHDEEECVTSITPNHGVRFLS